MIANIGTYKNYIKISDKNTYTFNDVFISVVKEKRKKERKKEKGH